MEFYFDVIPSRDSVPEQRGPFDSRAEAEKARKDYLSAQWAPCASAVYPNLHEAALRMQRMGGGFATSVAEAWFRADSGNRARLEAAFEDLFNRYSEEA